MSFFGRIWTRLRGKEDDPTFGTQIAIVGATAAVVEHETDATPDYGWSGEHLSPGSDSGGGGGFDGGGGGDGGGGS